MTPGLCLDTGEFIPASELNQRIEMKKLSDRALQSLRNAGNEYEEAANEIEELRSRIAELEAQLEKGKQLCREQTATIVDRTKTVLDLEAQLASGQEPLGQVVTNTRGEMTFCKSQPYWDTAVSVVDVYTRPAPAQQPLGDDLIAKACKHLMCVHPNAQTTLDIARAIEVAHGIKENP
jgi:ElaB/YqjD/DUF883 family membrane-anchored ribosome-binding protein